MHAEAQRLAAIALAAGLFGLSAINSQAQPANPAVAPTAPTGTDWPVFGGSVGNQRYSALDQIDTGNVANLKGQWVVHTGSGQSSTRYSFEASPIVQGGIMYVPSGNDDIFAYDARTGAELWEYRSNLDQSITTVCCGWDNRGVAVGDGLVFSGRLDGSVMALDQTTGRLEWQTQVGRWQDGYTITSAPLFYDGVVYTGVSGGEKGIRGKFTALDAKSGQELWHFWTVPGPGEFGGDTWPAGSDAYLHGGASVWNTPTVDPDLGLIYFSTGNAGPDFDGSVRPGNNLFTASIVALHLDGSYAWHFQQVHHDIWDFDSASPTVLFDTTINGRPVKALAEAAKTGWLYLLDRTNGRPLIGIDERPVPQEAEQITSTTQPYPVGDAVMPQCAEPLPGWISACLFDTYSTTQPRVFAPRGAGGTNWGSMSYSQQTGAFYVGATIRPVAMLQRHQAYDPAAILAGVNYQAEGSLSPLVGAHLSGTLSAVDAATNKIVWQNKTIYGEGSNGNTTTAGGLLFHGEPDGYFQALDVRTGKLLWQWQTGAGADAPPITYMLDGVQYVTIAAGGTTSGNNSPRGDMIWTFSLNGKLQEFAPPDPKTLPQTVTGFSGAITATNNVSMVDFSFAPGRIQIKLGDTVTFTNNGAQAHTATMTDVSGFDTGLITPGGSSSLTFDQPGTYIYTCTPHPFMFGQILVADADGNIPATSPVDPNPVHQ